MLNPELQSRIAKQYHGRGREIPPNRKINIGKDMRTSALGVLYHEAQPVRQFPPNYRPSPTPPCPLAYPEPPRLVPPNRALPSSLNRVASRSTSTAPFKEAHRATSVQSTPRTTLSQAPRHLPVNHTVAPNGSRQNSASIRRPSTPTAQGPASQQLRTVGNENIVPFSGNESPPLSPELSNVLFRCEVDFPNPTRPPNRSSVPSMLYLSAARRPHMGVFTLTCEGKQVCQCPVSQYYHHSIDTRSRELVIMFRSPGGHIICHTVNFKAYMAADDFHQTLKRLRAGEYLDQVNESSRQVLEATIQEATQSTVNVPSTPANQNPVPQARAEQSIAPDLDTVLRQPIGPNVNTAYRAENQETLIGTLIDLDTFDNVPSTVQPQYARSEAAELLSTLDPIEYELEHVDDDLQLQQAQTEATELLSTLDPIDYELGHVDNNLRPTSPSQQSQSEAAEQNYGLHVIKQEFVDRYRLLLQNLIKVLGDMPKNKTRRGASQMIEGLQMCVTDQAMDDECGLDESTKRELLKEVWGNWGFQPSGAEDSAQDIQSAPNPPPNRPETPRPPLETARATPREASRPPPPGVTTQTRRQVYQRPFLVSLYDNRLQPPHWLNELAFMPAFSRRNQPPSTCQSLEATLSATSRATRPATPLPAAAFLAPDFSRSLASHAWVMATEASETVESTPTITSESTAQDVQAEAQEPQIEEPTPVVSLETTASPSHEEHVDADIRSGPELISLAVPEPTRPPSTHTNLRGLRHSLWARLGDRLETEGAFTGPRFWSSASLRELAQLDPQAPVNATPDELAEMFSARPSNQSIEHVAPRLAPGLQNDRPTSVPNHRPATPANNTSCIGGLTPQDQTPLATQRVADTPTQQPSSINAPPVQVEPPVISSSLANRGLADSSFAISPAPESFSVPESSSVPAPPHTQQSAPPNSSANPGLAGSRWASSPTPESYSGTNSPVVQAQPPAPVVEAPSPAPAPRPINRGLAGSRFASGKVLSSSGSFTGCFSRT